MIQVTEDSGSEIGYSEIETVFATCSPCGGRLQNEGDQFQLFFSSGQK